MRKLITILFLALSVPLHAETAGRDGGALPSQGDLIGGKGADGKFHYFLVGNDGKLNFSSAGATTGATSQVTTSTTAATLAIARPTRRSLLIKNIDATITVYIGPATVTALNGMPLKAGESVVVSAVNLWQVISASGAPVVAVLDEWD